jgi:hypothetical protein
MNGWKGARDGIIVSEKLSRELALRLEICQCRLPVLPPREGIWKPKSCLPHLYFDAISGTEILVERFSVTKTEAVVNRDWKSKQTVQSQMMGRRPWFCRCFAGIKSDRCVRLGSVGVSRESQRTIKIVLVREIL